MRVQILLGLVVSVVCAWLALRTVPLGELGASLATASYGWLLPALVLQLLAVVARGKRWAVLLGERARLSDAFWAQGVGYLFTNVLPLRMGEPARTFVMASRSGLPVVQTAATVVVERLLDVASVVVVLVAILPFMRVPSLVARAGISFGLLVLLGFGLLLMAVRCSALTERLLRAVLGRVPLLPAEPIVARWRELLVGLSSTTRWSVAVQATLWSVVAWACVIGSYLASLKAFEPAADPLEAAFMVVALAFAVTVPSSPGFIGVFQLVGEQALVLPFGAKYAPSTALSITLVAYLVYYLLTSLLGIVGLWQLGASFAKLRNVFGTGHQLVAEPAAVEVRPATPAGGGAPPQVSPAPVTRTPRAPRAAPRVRHAIAVVGIVALTWIAFGSVFGELGHRGDSWAYMSIGEQDGPYAIAAHQMGRPVLPLAWMVGWAIAGADPWIYHLLSFAFQALAAACLYGIVVLLLPRQVPLAFALAALAALWPADPTRYDASTLGNRQALAFMLLGALLYLASLLQRRPGWLVAGVVLLTASLLTYEGQLFLLGLLPLLAFFVERGFTRRWWTYALAAAVPIAASALANAAALGAAIAAGRRNYQTVQATGFALDHIPRQIAGAFSVLFVDSWRLPLELLRAGAVPRQDVVQSGGLVFVGGLVALAWLSRRDAAPLSRRSGLVLVWLGGASILLGAAVFSVSQIALSEPGRAHTFTMFGAAAVVVGLTWLLAGLIPGRGAVAQLLRLGPSVLVCGLAAFLFLSMAAVYQRNFIDSWREQRQILAETVKQAPDIETSTLVIMAGLPDTRVVFASGYTCEFALRYLFGQEQQLAEVRSIARTADEVLNQRVSCGLLYDGPNYLDAYTKLEFQPDGVHYRFRRFDYLYPYDRVVLFDAGDGERARLLDELPARLLPPGMARPVGYNPRALIRDVPVRPAARQILGLSP